MAHPQPPSAEIMRLVTDRLPVAKPGALSEPWPEPIDILADPTATGIASIDRDCVPATLCDLAVSEGARLGTDPVGIATAAIGVCSGIISDDFKVRLKFNDRGWRESPRLWVCLLADSGAKKSEQIKVAVRPVFALQATMRDRNQRDMQRYAEDHKAWKKHGKKAGEEEPEPPRMERIVCSDFTIEALSEMLANGASKMLVYADELAQFLGMFERYSGSAKINSGRGHMLSAYEGGPHMVDRVLRGATYIPNWSIALVGGIQPNRLRGSVTDLASDGLLQRMMMVRVPFAAGQGDDDDRPQDQDAVDRYAWLVEQLHLLRPHDMGDGKHPDVRGRPEDQDRIHSARRRVFSLSERVERDSMLPGGLRQSASKWRGTLARLCAVYHCIRVAEAGTADQHRLQPETVEMAARFMLRLVIPATFQFYLEADDSGDSPIDSARWIAGHILAHGLQGITRRDIGRASLGLRGKTQPIMDAMEVLADTAWVRSDGVSASPSWTVNPLVHVTFPELAAKERSERMQTREKIREHALALAARHAEEMRP